LLGSANLVQGVLEDLEGSEIADNWKALLRFVDKVNHSSPDITAEDVKALHAAGWSDSAVYDAVTVCAVFNFYNRWIDACGVHAMSDEAHREFGARTAHHGYIRK